jgi:hypothetical protein
VRRAGNKLILVGKLWCGPPRLLSTRRKPSHFREGCLHHDQKTAFSDKNELLLR